MARRIECQISSADSCRDTSFRRGLIPAIVDGATLVKGRVLGDDAGKPKLDPMGQPIMQPATNGVPGIGDNGGPPLEPVWEVPPGQKRRTGRPRCELHDLSTHV